jgi:hypothetical protein
MLILRLGDPDRADTRWDGPPAVRALLKSINGFDVFLETGFRDIPTTLQTKISARCQAYKAALALHGPGPAGNSSVATGIRIP